MPQSALNRVPSARVLPLQQIPALLRHLIREELPLEPEPRAKAPLGAAKETRIAELDMDEVSSEARLGHPSPFACPDCGGVLWEIE
jgi:two-component system chemotaxis response regulator CheB